MIDHERKIIFIHLAKTGGMSVGKSLFGDSYWHNDSLRIAEIGSSLNLDSYFKFCFVRNPWEQMVSHYYQAQKPANLHLEQRARIHIWSTTLSFPDYVTKVAKDEPEVFFRHGFFWKMTDLVGNIRADFVGRFERLESDFANLCKLCSIPPTPLKKINIGNHAPYQHYYNTSARDLVGELFKLEIKTFEYRFEELE